MQRAPVQTSTVVVGRSALIWMIAFAIGTEALAQAVVAFLERHPAQVVVWLVAWTVIAFSATQSEKIKWFLEG